MLPCRHADLREVTLSVGGAPVLRFAAAYGFRNIQASTQGWASIQQGVLVPRQCTWVEDSPRRHPKRHSALPNRLAKDTHSRC